jgi:hypothetical protein
MAFGSTSDSVYGSGLLHAWVKDKDGNIYDFDAIVSSDADPEMESTEIPGDDEIKATFNSNQKATLNLTANAFSFDAYAAITGNPVIDVAAVTGAGAHAAYKHTAGGTVAENNPPFVELGFVTQAKDNLGNEAHYVRVFHKVQCKPVKTPQENNSELSFELDATAYTTATDIEGSALASRRIDTKYFVDGAWNPASPIFAAA